jgi:hypothetical protein
MIEAAQMPTASMLGAISDDMMMMMMMCTFSSLALVLFFFSMGKGVSTCTARSHQDLGATM